MSINNRWAVAASGVLLMLVAGLVYAWSVMSIPIASEYPQWTKTQLSLTFTIMMTLFCLGCVASGYLSKKLAPRILVWLSALLFTVGFLLASRISTLMGLYLTFGVICGFASGIVYNTTLSTVGRWFPDKQGLISGVMLMGFGLSSFLIGKAFSAYTPDEMGGWRSSFTFIGIAIFIIFVLCSFILKKPGEDFVHRPAAKAKSRRANPVGIDATPGVMLKRPAFGIFYAWAIAVSAGGLALVSQASGIALQVDPTISAETVATVAGLISIFNGIGRVILGGMFDYAGRSVTMQLTNTLFILAGAVILVALTTGSFAVLVIGFIIGGLAYGGVTPTNSAFVSSYYGIKNYPMNLSVVNTNLIFASFGSTLAGSLYDASHSYISTIIMVAGLGTIGILLSLGISRLDKKQVRENT